VKVTEEFRCTVAQVGRKYVGMVWLWCLTSGGLGDWTDGIELSTQMRTNKNQVALEILHNFHKPSRTIGPHMGLWGRGPSCACKKRNGQLSRRAPVGTLSMREFKKINIFAYFKRPEKPHSILSHVAQLTPIQGRPSKVTKPSLAKALTCDTACHGNILCSGRQAYLSYRLALLHRHLCMGTGNFLVCHIPLNYMCVACGQILAKEGLPPLSTCSIRVVCSFCSAVLLLSAQMCWTCPNQAPAPSTLPCQIALCWTVDTPAGPSPAQVPRARAPLRSLRGPPCAQA
jgi:hypothetical protein